MDFLFGSKGKIASTVMIVGFLCRLAIAVLSIVSVLTYNSDPKLYFALSAVADLIIFVGSLIYYFGEDTDSDVKNVYGTILFSFLVNAFFFFALGKINMPFYLILIIMFLGVVFELLATCNIGIFVTNNDRSSFNKVLCIITIVLVVVAIIVSAIELFSALNDSLKGDFYKILEMIINGCICGCTLFSIVHLISYNSRN